ncbi:MAG: M23 family metallopeptidase [Deltaproteobacteria bacterium]|nr:M23 family metallopeptidase [Deltaproteobacteria bacterium]
MVITLSKRHDRPMNKVRYLFKEILIPVTIMVVPHGDLRSLNIKIPPIGIILTLLLSVVGGSYIFSLMADGFKYPALVEKVNFYSKQFSQWNSTVSSLREAEKDFRRIFSLNSKEEILETVDTSYSGSIDIQNIVLNLQKRTEKVDEIKDYLRIQKDIYLATPKGYPVNGKVTSPYGRRVDPFDKISNFHSGIDLSASPGTAIRASADGIVSYSGWTSHNGYVVVLEHGCSFSTVYAHNKKNAVKVGQKIKRESILGYVGSTGRSTGPHVHYEVWKSGNTVDPQNYFHGNS